VSEEYEAGVPKLWTKAAAAQNFVILSSDEVRDFTQAV